MTAEAITIVYHLATVILGALFVKQLKQAGWKMAMWVAFFVVLTAQFLLAVGSILYSLRPGMIAASYLTVFIFVPASLLAGVIWLVVGIRLTGGTRST